MIAVTGILRTKGKVGRDTPGTDWGHLLPTITSERRARLGDNPNPAHIQMAPVTGGTH